MAKPLPPTTPLRAMRDQAAKFANEQRGRAVADSLPDDPERAEAEAKFRMEGGRDTPPVWVEAQSDQAEVISSPVGGQTAEESKSAWEEQSDGEDVRSAALEDQMYRELRAHPGVDDPIGLIYRVRDSRAREALPPDIREIVERGRSFNYDEERKAHPSAKSVGDMGGGFLPPFEEAQGE